MRRSWLLVLLSAVLTGLARLPLYTGWLGFLSLVPLLYYFGSGKKSWKVLLMDAAIYSVVNLSLWLHWIWGVTSGGLVGILLFYSLYFFAAFAAIQLIWQRLPRFRFIGFILIFLVVEYLQNFTEFRFPWINLGYALTDYSLLLQAADLGGVVLLSLLLLLANIFFYQILQRKWSYLIWTGVLLLIWGGYGLWCLRTLHLERADASITMMQPSIPQEDKWESEHFEELYKRYAEMTAAAARDSTRLLIWPEAAMPAYVLREAYFRTLIQDLCEAYKLDIFAGFPDTLPAPPGYPGEMYYYNAATLFRTGQPPAEPYYKMVLVPVGERIPLLHVFPFLWKLQFGQANWEYGPAPRYYTSGGVTFSPQICFEIAFPELTRQMAWRSLDNQTSSPPEKIDFLVNITNDAWFGRSSGPWVHGMMARFRAIENRIQIYRCANTGITMAIDPLGRILARTKLFDIANVHAPLYVSERNPIYCRIYAWPRLLVGLAALLIIGALATGKKSTLPTGGKP